jgi:hypothetical protein
MCFWSYSCCNAIALLLKIAWVELNANVLSMHNCFETCKSPVRVIIDDRNSDVIPRSATPVQILRQVCRTFPNKPSARVLKPHYQRMCYPAARMSSPMLERNTSWIPCMTVVSVELSTTASLECCLHHEEDANAGPSSVNERLSDHTDREPSMLLLHLEDHHGHRGPCLLFHA